MRESLGQLEQCNLRPGPEPDGKAGCADSAIDVKHSASVLVPSVGVTIDQATEVELTANARQRQLAAMRVPCQYQINTQLGGAIEDEHRGFVCQQDIDGPRHHQPFVQPPG